MGKRWVFIIFMLAVHFAQAQADSTLLKDSVLKKDSILKNSDTLAARVDTVPLVVKPTYNFLWDSSIYNHQPFYTYTNPVMHLTSKKQWQGKEGFFYTAVAMLLFFALVRNNYTRYSKDLFGMFFQTTVKQRQVKEQMMQAPLPSLLLNILFFITAALFINLWLVHLQLGSGYNFWLLFLYSILGLAAIYFVKFLTLKLCGWIFRLSEATDSYIFIVFTTNKIIGIALLPLIIVMSFTSGVLQQSMFTLSLIVVGFLFLYRYFLSYTTIHRQVKINILHFVLYLVAFEIVPLLLINKVLFQFLGENS